MQVANEINYHDWSKRRNIQSNVKLTMNPLILLTVVIVQKSNPHQIVKGISLRQQQLEYPLFVSER